MPQEKYLEELKLFQDQIASQNFSGVKEKDQVITA